jgi:hypothetical protein
MPRRASLNAAGQAPVTTAACPGTGVHSIRTDQPLGLVSSSTTTPPAVTLPFPSSVRAQLSPAVPSAPCAPQKSSRVERAKLPV